MRGVLVIFLRLGGCGILFEAYSRFEIIPSILGSFYSILAWRFCTFRPLSWSVSKVTVCSVWDLAVLPDYLSPFSIGTVGQYYMLGSFSPIGQLRSAEIPVGSIFRLGSMILVSHEFLFRRVRWVTFPHYSCHTIHRIRLAHATNDTDSWESTSLCSLCNRSETMNIGYGICCGNSHQYSAMGDIDIWIRCYMRPQC